MIKLAALALTAFALFSAINSIDLQPLTDSSMNRAAASQIAQIDN